MKRYSLALQFLFLIEFFSLQPCAMAQQNAYNNLKEAIKNSTGSTRVNNMLVLANHLLEEGVYDSTCIYWANEAEKNATALNDMYSVAKASELKARYYFNKSVWNESIKAFETTLSTVDRIPVPLQRNEMNFKGLMGLAEVYNYMGDYVSALDYRLKGLKLIDSIKTDASGRINAYVSIANDFRHLDQRTKAIDYLRQIEVEVPQAKGNYQLDYYYEYYQNLLLNGQVEESKKILSRYDSAVMHFNLSTAQRLEFAGIGQKLHGQYELNYTKNFAAAVSCFKKYLDYSIRLDNQTHIAIAYNKIGIACDSLKDYPAAIEELRRSYDICIREEIIDYGYKSALHLATLYERMGDFKQAYFFSSAAYTLKDKLDTESKLQELNQLEAKYQASRKEKQITELKLANAEHAIKESQQKQSLSNTRFIIALVILIGMIILFFLYRYYHKRQLKEIAIRNNISRDLHDDIGATLSSINLYGELAHSVIEKQPANSKEMIGKMTNQAKDLMGRMGDVIWSMKPVGEEKNSFTSRLKNYCSELLSPKEINCDFNIDEKLVKKINSPVVRKNMLLIAKEAMNNIGKYSNAKNASISFQQLQEKIILTIKDDGNGFDSPAALNGNGLGNMKQRCEQLKGIFRIESIPGNGVAITCTFPIAIFSFTG